MNKEERLMRELEIANAHLIKGRKEREKEIIELMRSMEDKFMFRDVEAVIKQIKEEQKQK